MSEQYSKYYLIGTQQKKCYTRLIGWFEINCNICYICHNPMKKDHNCPNCGRVFSQKYSLNVFRTKYIQYDYVRLVGQNISRLDLW